MTTTTTEITWIDAGDFTYGRTVYQLARNADPDHKLAYRLTGVRGAEYVLMRNVPRPYMLFAVNGRRFTGSTPFRDQWFTDRNGILEHVR